MTRTSAREIAVHLVFEQGFDAQSLDELLTPELFARRAEEEGIYAQFPDEVQLAYIRQLAGGVADHGAELDEYISRYAVGWNFARIPRVAASIMRVAMYEMLYMPDIPNAAAINEAVEIAKKYEPAEVVSFINGILGSFARAEFGEQ